MLIVPASPFSPPSPSIVASTSTSASASSSLTLLLADESWLALTEERLRLAGGSEDATACSFFDMSTLSWTTSAVSSPDASRDEGCAGASPLSIGCDVKVDALFLFEGIVASACVCESVCACASAYAR